MDLEKLERSELEVKRQESFVLRCVLQPTEDRLVQEEG